MVESAAGILCLRILLSYRYWDGIRKTTIGVHSIANLVRNYCELEIRADVSILLS
jgi:hypothetical protein